MNGTVNRRGNDVTQMTEGRFKSKITICNKCRSSGSDQVNVEERCKRWPRRAGDQLTKATNFQHTHNDNSEPNCKTPHRKECWIDEKECCGGVAEAVFKRGL